MSEELLASLRSAFFRELQERLKRARGILDEPLSAADLDRLHQEFDSLYGAARAVNCPRLEAAFRTLAEFARWLRRGPPGAPAEADHRLLTGAVDKGLRCQGGTGCDACALGSAGELQAIMKRIESERRPAAAAKGDK